MDLAASRAAPVAPCRAEGGVFRRLPTGSAGPELRKCSDQLQRGLGAELADVVGGPPFGRQPPGQLQGCQRPDPRRVGSQPGTVAGACGPLLRRQREQRGRSNLTANRAEGRNYTVRYNHMDRAVRTDRPRSARFSLGG